MKLLPPFLYERRVCSCSSGYCKERKSLRTLQEARSPIFVEFSERAHPSEQKKAIEQDTELVGSIYRPISFKRMSVNHARGLKLGILQRMTKEQADEAPFLL